MCSADNPIRIPVTSKTFEAVVKFASCLVEDVAEHKYINMLKLISNLDS